MPKAAASTENRNKTTQAAANGALGAAGSSVGVVSLIVWLVPDMPAEVAAALGAGAMAVIQTLGQFLRNATGDNGVSRWVG